MRSALFQLAGRKSGQFFVPGEFCAEDALEKAEGRCTFWVAALSFSSLCLSNLPLAFAPRFFSGVQPMNALLRRQANNRVDNSLACQQARVFARAKKHRRKAGGAS
jgi:hypothetical protein